ncbi:MAG TPA: beta-L-arabinofuranosidase domain-containing protein [Candidatus Acidoferrum sp.]|nr:beta-L-arabinofuranosidase domain-containing protein [Candidatus Acidoferrum sp.]
MCARVTRRQFVSATSAAVLANLPMRMATLSRDQTSLVPLSTNPPWTEQGILNLAHSPFAKLKNVPIRAVRIDTGFWASRRTVNVETSIPSMGKLLEANGRMDNFRRLTGKGNAAQRGPVYSDSDVYKWLEAVGFALQSDDRPELRALAASRIKDVVAAQAPSGYLNTYYVGEHAAQRMEPKTQQWGHELYNIGHLLQGATAYYRATGERTLLDAGIRFVDDFLLPTYGPGPDKKPILSGHPEIELALVELYRMTGDKRHLQLAEYTLRGDDRISLKQWDYVYHFCGKPFTSRTHLEGHAVRAMYACCGATDYYLETGDASYWKTLNTLWNDLVSRQMYVTGGVGARSDGEAFGDPYELPNAQAYGESCAAIGNMMWNWRMLAATGDARYADVIERTLYNGINSGMSLSGTLYCYRNPLAFAPENGDKIRNDWYDTTCCPPNLERTFASLPGYFYSTSSDGLYVHLFHNSELSWRLENGTPLKVVQKTNYPWQGVVDIEVNPSSPTEFAFYLRVPGWSDRSVIAVNGKPVSGAVPGRYLPIRRRWASGDVIHLELDMSPQILEANAHVVEDHGRAAVQRGPLVYCLEQLDQPSGVALADVALLAETTNLDKTFSESFDKDLLDGVVVLHHEGVAVETSDPRRALYFSFSAARSKTNRIPLTFIPYYAWANRTPTPMVVWTPLLKS